MKPPHIEINGTELVEGQRWALIVALRSYLAELGEKKEPGVVTLAYIDRLTEVIEIAEGGVPDPSYADLWQMWSVDR